MRFQRSRLVVGCALVLAAGVVGMSAQAPPKPAPPATPAPGTQAGQPDFRSGVDFVTMDAIVRNSRDQFVADLTKDDFEIFEDGVKQEIASLTLVHGGRVHNLQAPPPPATGRTSAPWA